MSEAKKASIRLLMLLTSPRLAERAAALLEREGAPVCLRFAGRGTASREMMDMLGLDSGEKTLLLTVLHNRAADALLLRLRRGLRLGSANSGVACTVPLTGGSSRLVALAQEMGASQETGRAVIMENAYQLVVALVNQGFSEEVMAAARPAGATGGTVISGRRAGGEETLQLWGFGVQQEREAVLILCRAEEKKAIMEAVRAACGLESEAQGTVFSLPVDGAVGLE